MHKYSQATLQLLLKFVIFSVQSQPVKFQVFFFPFKKLKHYRWRYPELEQ